MHFTLHNNNSSSSTSLKSKSFFSGFSRGRHESHNGTTPVTPSADHTSIAADDTSEEHVHSEHSHSPPETHNDSHQTMQPLKRFFRPSLRKNSSTQSSGRSSPAASSSTLSLSKHTNDPFDGDGVLAQKYGRLGKILGSGAGGSVRLLTRPSDGITFAVKEFRPKRPNEEMREYAKKCTAEFCIGSTLHHPNIIETLDIAHEGDHYYEVMEYCPVDFFAVVMSGKMSRGEINCCFRQISEGVAYLHKMGIAHRDLKLDNCVVTSDGIVKLIDFGSAVVFRYPYEEKIVKAHGVCGSDPYLAPEVLTSQKYDPRPVDIWSVAIIYCCMTLKRFPWKAPKTSDPSFRLYCMEDDRPHDYLQAAKIHAELIRRRKEERLKKEEEAMNKDNVEKVTEVLDATHIKGEEYKATSDANGAAKLTDQSPQLPQAQREQLHQQPQGQHGLHGPYRLMRLLPHAARPLLSRMLEVDPNKRATLKDMFEDDWFSTIVPCTTSKGKLIPGPGHAHIEIKEENAHLESYKGRPMGDNR